MIGAIIGDIVGSCFEFQPIKTKDFPLFSPDSDYTDDSLMTIAVGMALNEAIGLGKEEDPDFLQSQFTRAMQAIGRAYPNPTGEYGLSFFSWLKADHPHPYNSWGNGSAMRVSACGERAKSLDQAIFWAKQSAVVSHNHPDGIKGAEAVAAAIFLAKEGQSKQAIRAFIQEHFYPDIPSVEAIRPTYSFDPSCQGTVPQTLAAFFDSSDFEDAIRNAISLGGDADTIGAITGSVAWSFYVRQTGVTQAMSRMAEEAMGRIPEEFRDFVAEYEKNLN